MLRSETEERVLWVDAICINQEDVLERNSQVALMGDIFKRATLVRVWLGQNVISSACTTLIFDLVRHMIGNKISTWKHDLKEEARKSDVIEVLRGIHELGSTSYWSRVWIVQEIGLAQKAKIHFGEDHLSREDFMSVLINSPYLHRAAVNSDWGFDIDFDRLFKCRASRLLRRVNGQLAVDLDERNHGRIYPLLTSGRDISLGTCLDMTRESCCTVRHDRVYALLALATDIPPGVVQFDYNRSLPQLKDDVIQWYCETHDYQRIDGDGPMAVLNFLLDTALGLTPEYNSSSRIPFDWDLHESQKKALDY
jgi:hypothetical protein